VTTLSAYPTQRQLILPLVQTLDNLGRTAKPRDVCDGLAAACGIPPPERERRVLAGKAGWINAWDRRVRWAKLSASLRGLVVNAEPNLWSLTTAGRDALGTAARGTIITVFETEMGIAVHADCETAVAYVTDDSIQLILTSPPYPLIRKKPYGNEPADRYVDWLLECARDWLPKLTADGSLVLNLGDAWLPSVPCQSLYQERLLIRLHDELGLHLAQRLYWYSPSKLPSPAEWVTIRRLRVTPAVEMVYWLSKSPHPKADNRRVLRQYSDAMRRRLNVGGERKSRRPSGHLFQDGAFSMDQGGSIPHNLLTLPHSHSNDRYQRACRNAGLPVHPARFPAGLPEFFIRLTTDPGDVAWDPFGGSLTVAETAERYGVHWIANDRSRIYLDGGALRFPGATWVVAQTPAQAKLK